MKNAALRGPMPAKIKCEIADDFEYAERSNYWLQKSKERPWNYRHKRRDRTPVILCGHGISLRIDRGTLLIRNGFTHYPQEREEFRYFRGDLNLPSRILVLDGTGSISFDVLAWLGEQRIPLIQINWKGDVQTVASESGHSADPKLVAAQIAALENGQAKKIARRLIAQKLSNSILTLQKCAPNSHAKDAAISHIEKQAKLVARNSGYTGSALLGSEGRSAALYFQAFHGMPIRWTGIGRQPIPRDWHFVGPRLSPLTESNWRARHPVNAMLNYGYAVIYGQVRTHILAQGLDPGIGLMHRSASKMRDNLALDMMEPLRPIVERRVFESVCAEGLSASDYFVGVNGVCKLGPQLARTLVVALSRTSELNTLCSLVTTALLRKQP